MQSVLSVRVHHYAPYPLDRSLIPYDVRIVFVSALSFQAAGSAREGRATAQAGLLSWQFHLGWQAADIHYLPLLSPSAVLLLFSPSPITRY